MRLAALMISLFALSACVTGQVDPVPETGAFSLKYVELDGDYYLQIDKVGGSQSVVVSKESHPNRRQWRDIEWQRFADTLFPADEISFDALRTLRGSDIVPVGLVSPTPATIPPCETTGRRDYAKVQTRLIRRAPPRQRKQGDAITMVTDCELHEGLLPNQYAGIHQRPNPYRFPTRYETIVDLDRDGRSEQRNVRIRNVPKAQLFAFIEKETVLDRKVREQMRKTLDRF